MAGLSHHAGPDGVNALLKEGWHVAGWVSFDIGEHELRMTRLGRHTSRRPCDAFGVLLFSTVYQDIDGKANPSDLEMEMIRDAGLN